MIRGIKFLKNSRQFHILKLQQSSIKHVIQLQLINNVKFTSIRKFSSDNKVLKDAINKIHSEQTQNPTENSESSDQKEEKEIPANDKESQEQTTNNSQSSSNTNHIGNLFTGVQKATTFVSENVKLAFEELLGKNKQTTLKKKVAQAESYRKPTDGDDENDEDNNYDGPTALVAVKGTKSAWEEMSQRLQGLKIIKEILKNTKKISDAASNTDIGKKAKEVSQNLQDKIEDAREIWETSQNPLIYTISGVWENMTGQTDESLAVEAIRKLDSTFVKVSQSF